MNSVSNLMKSFMIDILIKQIHDSSYNIMLNKMIVYLEITLYLRCPWLLKVAGESVSGSSLAVIMWECSLFQPQKKQPFINIVWVQNHAQMILRCVVLQCVALFCTHYRYNNHFSSLFSYNSPPLSSTVFLSCRLFSSSFFVLVLSLLYFKIVLIMTPPCSNS